MNYDHLFIAGVEIDNTDDALRLLRIVDDLYVHPEAPRLHFSAATPPHRWFRAADQGHGLAADVARKFTRTVSRLHALCDIEAVANSDEPVPDEPVSDARD
jgi:cell division protein ZapE